MLMLNVESEDILYQIISILAHGEIVHGPLCVCLYSNKANYMFLLHTLSQATVSK